MTPLTDEENEFYEKQKVCHICKKEFNTDEFDTDETIKMTLVLMKMIKMNLILMKMIKITLPLMKMIKMNLVLMKTIKMNLILTKMH